MDPYGTLAKTDYSAQGLGIYVSLSTMDRYWRPDLTQEEAIGLMKRCINEVQIRTSLFFWLLFPVYLPAPASGSKRLVLSYMSRAADTKLTVPTHPNCACLIPCPCFPSFLWVWNCPTTNRSLLRFRLQRDHHRQRRVQRGCVVRAELR